MADTSTDGDPGARPLRNGVLAALAAPALPMAAMTLPLTIFLPAFYASVIGIDLAIVGIVFTIVRVADLFFDPFVGGLMDRTRSRWGRFKPWLAVGGPIVMAGAAMLFMAQPGAGPLYLGTALIIAYAGYSIIILSQMGIGSALTPDYHERSRVFAWWQVFNVLGLIIVLLAPPLLAQIMPVTSTTTVRTMGWAILASTPITILVALLVVRDTSRAAPASVSHLPIRAYLGLFGLRSVRTLLASVLMTGLGLGVSSAAFVFFFADLKSISAEELGLMLTGFFVVNICAAPAWAWIGNRIGKHRALAAGGVGTAIYMTIIAFMPERDFLTYGIACVIGGFSACSADILPRAMMADVSDEDRLASGHERAGMLYALLLITHKIGQALAIGVVYVLLDLIGFNAAAGRDNSAGALFGILLLGSIVPGILHLSGGLISCFYPLTAERHATIRQELRDHAPIHHPGEALEMAEPGHFGAAIPAVAEARH